MSPNSNKERRSLPNDMKALIKEAVKEAMKEEAQVAVTEALSKSPVLSQTDALALIRTTLRETFISFGADPDKPLEMQKDFQHLRAWRESVNTIKTRGLWTAVGIIVAGALGFMLLGFQSKFGLTPK